MRVKYFCPVLIGLNKGWRSSSYFKIILFLAICDTQQKKDDVIMTSYRFDPDFLCRKIFILSPSYSVQNLSSLNLTTGLNQILNVSPNLQIAIYLEK